MHTSGTMQRSVKFLIAFAIFLCAAPGCKSPQDPGTGTDNATRNWPEEGEVFDVTLDEDVVSIGEAELAACLVQDNDTGSGGTYRFVDPPAEIAGLQAGQKTILSGLDVVTIESVSFDGSELTLQTSPAVLTDVIRDGTIYWSRAITMEDTPRDGLLGPGLRRSLIKPQTTLKYNGAIGQFEVQYSLTARNNATDIDMLAKIGAAPGVKFSVSGKGTVNQFHTEGSITVENGAITYFEYIVRDVDLTMDIQFGGVETGRDEDGFKLPLTLRLPAPVGPLPTWIGIGGAVEFKSTLVDNTSTTGTARVRARGTYGVRDVNGDITFLSGSSNMAEVSFGADTTAVATITSGLGIVLEFPKISLGVGVSALSGAIYTSMKNEVLTNFEARYDMAGPVPVISGSCYTGSINTGFYVGVETLFFGLAGIKQEGAVWVQGRELFQEGNACD